MANRRYFQFLYSKTPMLTVIQGAISIVQEVKASLTTQGVTLTAVAFGTSGNSISIAFTPGAVAGAEVVTVTGNAISVQIDTGVSTVTDVRTAINADVSAAALVLATGTAITTVSTAAALFLSGGIDGVSSENLNGASVAQSGVGEYTITLADSYNALVSAGFQVVAATPVDLIPQIKSQTIGSTNIIVVRLLSGATPTDPSAALTLECDIFLRNSSVSL